MWHCLFGDPRRWFLAAAALMLLATALRSLSG